MLNLVNPKNRIWARYISLDLMAGWYIGLFFAIPAVSMCYGALSHSEEIDGGVPNAVRDALLGGLMWGLIILAAVTVLFLCLFLLRSATVEFTENELRYYPRLWSKKARVIPYETITKCVFMNELQDKRKIEYCGKILLYHEDDVILNLQLYAKLCAEFIKRLDDEKVFFTDSNFSPRTVDRYFALDFRALPYEQQQKLLKYYCDYVKFKGEKTGEELLRKK